MTGCSENAKRPACAQELLLGLALLSVIGFSNWFFGVDFRYAEAPKQLWAMGGLTLALLPAMFARPALNLREIWILPLPFVATFPGAFAHQWHWNYNVYAEWINTGLAFSWVLLWTQLWRNPRIGAQRAMLLLVAGVGMTLLWSVAEWVLHIVEWGVSKGFAPPATNFGNPNYAANFLILVFPFIMVLGRQRMLGRRWPWTVLAVATIVVLFLLLRTRAALMGWMIASYLALALWMKTRSVGRRAWIAWWSLPILFTAAIVVLSLFYWELAAHFRYLELVGPHAWYTRTYPWMVGWRSVLESPWIGYGPGASVSLFHGFVDQVPETVAVATGGDYLHIHAEYLEWLQEGGILGLTAYLLVWGWIIWRAVRMALDVQRDRAERWLAGAAAYGLLAYHLHSLVEVAARMPANRMALYAVGAMVLMLSVRQRPAENNAKEVAVSWWMRLAPATMLLLTGFALWKEIPRQRDTFMAAHSPERVEQDPYWRNRIDYGSDSIEAIYQRIIYKLYDQKDAQGVADLFDRMERRIPGFREDKFLRLFHYLVEHQAGGSKPAELGALLRRARAGSERYWPAVEHFSAQYAAHSQQPELLLEVLEDRLFRAGILFRVARADRRQDVRVRVDTEGSGFAMSYDSQGRLTFLMGMPQLRLLMEIASERMSEEEASRRIAAVPAKVRAQQEPVAGFRAALEAMALDYIRYFAVLARPPKI